MITVCTSPAPILLIVMAMTQAPPPSPIPATPTPLIISGNTVVPAHQLAMLDASGGPFDSINWRVFPPPQAAFTGRRNGAGYDFAGTPGVYTVWAVGAYIQDAKAATTDDSVSVVLQAPAPAPVPTPGPGPTPTPEPTPPPTPTPPPLTPVLTAKVWAVAVYDTGNMLALPQSQRDLRASPTIASSLASLDAVWRTYDVGSPTIQGATWQAEIKKVGVPCLILLEQVSPSTARIASSAPLPADEASVVAAVAKARGK
ncbi:unnamed protein product [uncultured bacterium]|nr:unnamed protein product [uncultured bacterium]